jgi:hypothetical protein
MLDLAQQKAAFDLKIEETKHEADIKLEDEKAEGSRKLERQKLDADLVKLALQGSEESRRQLLEFMVETNLISDPDIQKGVNGYLASKKPLPGIPEKYTTKRFVSRAKIAGQA